jgi:sphingomyelin phosphodiesterase acid-like 3
VLGNADSYLGAVPEPSFLSSNTETFYTKFLNGTVDHSEFLASFQKGGYYSAEPPGTNLMVIGLNTLMFVPFLKEFEQSAVTAELAWLDSRLASAKAAGKKVWLLMHVPPGADIYSTATKDYKGKLTTTATMMWEPPYQATFLQTVSKYPGLIALTLAAHTHMDEFRVYAPGNVLEISPSITPYFGNNPGFRVFSFAQDTLKPTDYTSFNYDLATDPLQFNRYYTFSDVYPSSATLNASFEQLSFELATNKEKQALYRDHYFSAHHYSIPAAGTFKQITDADWPVYYCGSVKMEQQAFIDCMTSY